MSRYLVINSLDNVGVALGDLEKGTTFNVNGEIITIRESISQGHKFAIKDIKQGDDIIKYGSPIGHSTSNIERGEFVHTHNLKTNLSSVLNYSYDKTPNTVNNEIVEKKFLGFVRDNGSVGIRNEIWIINTVGCVNKTAENIAKRFDNVYTFSHPYGCSQLGDDHKTTQKILKNLVHHPNAGAVLVLGLGCENNNIKEFKKVLGSVNETRVRFLETQSVNNELEEASKIIIELQNIISKDCRVPCNISELVIGLKCGGSDGLSGITANPLLGKISDTIIDNGGTSILTEVPEMFGAETILMNRAKNDLVFNNTVSLINNFKEYFIKHNQVVYENPSPGNKDGGITTLEEKSLGCTQKGGNREVEAVYEYGNIVTTKGLNLLNGPGNDIVAVTNLAAAGCHLLLFTTGRGTPLGGPVPTIKISSNNQLAERKKDWIDFNAGVLTTGESIDKLSDSLLNFIINVASGEKTLNEINNYREIAIFKDGVTL